MPVQWLDVHEADADNPVMTLSDHVVTLRPWSRDDAGFMAEAFADPAIRRYNGVLDRLGWPAPPLSIAGAEAVIDEFEASSRAFAETGKPTGVAFAITEAKSGALVGCCGVDDWSKADVALTRKRSRRSKRSTSRLPSIPNKSPIYCNNYCNKQLPTNVNL